MSRRRWVRFEEEGDRVWASLLETLVALGAAAWATLWGACVAASEGRGVKLSCGIGFEELMRRIEGMRAFRDGRCF